MSEYYVKEAKDAQGELGRHRNICKIDNYTCIMLREDKVQNLCYCLQVNVVQPRGREITLCGTYDTG